MLNFLDQLGNHAVDTDKGYKIVINHMKMRERDEIEGHEWLV